MAVPGAREPGERGARHLYVHLPFCAHRCGYCDFVTSVGRRGEHARLRRRAARGARARARAARRPRLETIFLGGGTPTFTEPAALERLLAALPAAAEVTVEANPETVTPELAALLRRDGVNRVSLGAQSFQPRLLEVLERVAGPDDVRRAVYHLRDAGFDNISLDLIYGIPGQSPAELASDLAEALALEPEHLSAYELEAKPGTRFTHAHGAELERQAESMESYFELVVETLTRRRLPLVRDGELLPRRSRGRRATSAPRHNLGYWLGHDYLGLGVGAVSTIENRRWRNAPSLRGYVDGPRGGCSALRARSRSCPRRCARPSGSCSGCASTSRSSSRPGRAVLDAGELERLERLGLVRRDEAAA